MRKKLYITFIVLLVAHLHKNVNAQSSYGMNFGVVVGDNGNIIQDSVYSFRNGYQVGVFGNFGTYGFFVSPGLYFKSVTIDNSFNKIEPFRVSPAIKIAKAKIIFGYQTNLFTRKIKLKLGGGMNGNYVILIDKNDADFNFNTLNDKFLGYNIDIGLDFFFLTFNISYEKSVKEVLSANGNNSGLDFFILSAGFMF